MKRIINLERNQSFMWKKKYLATTLSALTLAGIISGVTSEEIVQASNETVTRIQGETRFETAALISEESFDSAETVFITNAREFADALAGVPLAYQQDAPILLAQGNALNSATIAEIQRLGASNAVILGGEAAVSESIKGELEQLGLSTRRLAGDTRFETAEAIADELQNYVTSDKAVVVDGFEFADAMSVAPFAAQEGLPIYLSRTNSLTSDEALEDFSSTYIIGGESAISSSVEAELNNPTRIAGDTRYDTNILVLEEFGIDSNELFISTGLDFVDALTGSVLAANNGTGVALVRGGVTDTLQDFLKNNQVNTTRVFGGEAAVPERVMEELINRDPVSEATVNYTVELERYNEIISGNLPEWEMPLKIHIEGENIQKASGLYGHPTHEVEEVEVGMDFNQTLHIWLSDDSEFIGDANSSMENPLNYGGLSATYYVPLEEATYSFIVEDENGLENELTIEITSEDFVVPEDITSDVEQRIEETKSLVEQEKFEQALFNFLSIMDEENSNYQNSYYTTIGLRRDNIQNVENKMLTVFEELVELANESSENTRVLATYLAYVSSDYGINFDGEVITPDGFQGRRGQPHSSIYYNYLDELSSLNQLEELDTFIDNTLLVNSHYTHLRRDVSPGSYRLVILSDPIRIGYESRWGLVDVEEYE